MQTWLKRILQLFLLAISCYGLYRVIDGAFFVPAVSPRWGMGYLGKSTGVMTTVVTYGESVVSKILDGALTAFGSSIALYLISRRKKIIVNHMHIEPHINEWNKGGGTELK